MCCAWTDKAALLCAGIESDVNDMQGDLSGIKEMLTQLLPKR